jgi:serine/threonine protein kinase
MPDFGPRWKWVRDLREGGQGQTFVVKRADGADDLEYVLKRLKNPDRIDRFEREIEACKRLEHPNILRIVDADADPKGRPFLVTEYCPRGSLADNRPSVGTPVLEVLEIFRQICAAVAYAHDHDVVHRDIKPENILLREDGTMVLGDFGICFIDDEGTRITMTDEVAGSRFYCAPELRDGRLEDGVPATAADVYSLGKVLYWMLSRGQKFDREEHRTERYRLGKHDRGDPAWELVNELLDSMIVQDWRNRTLDGKVLLEQVDHLISVVRARGHAIKLSVPHRCMFCAQGEYKVHHDGTVPLPTDAFRQNQEAMRREAVVKSLGFNVPGSSASIIMTCDKCGHVLNFRPDLARNGLATWRRR